MVREQFIVSWAGQESKTVTEENMATLIISGNHVCKACATVKSFSSMPLFIDHLTQSHGMSLKEYFKSFTLRGYHDFRESKASFVFMGLRFRRLKAKKRIVVKEEKTKPFGKLESGEFVKNIYIEGVLTHQRIDVKKSKTSKATVGGIRPEDIRFLQSEKSNFVLSETFHRDTIQFLSKSGFSSMLLSGDQGTGKTTSIQQIAAIMRQPLIRVNITGGTKIEHLLQEQVIDTKNKTLHWQDKELIICAENGYWLLVDEISAGSPQVLFLFFRVLEEGEIRTLDGRTIKPHPNFKILFTDNRIGNPNYYRYHGTNAQNASLISRMSTTIWYSSLSAENEKFVLTNKFGLPEQFARDLVRFANLLRIESDNGTFAEVFSTRDVENIAKNFVIFNDPKKALNYGFMNKLQEKVDKDFVMALWQRVFGTAQAATN